MALTKVTNNVIASINGSKLIDNTVPGAKIADNTLDAGKIYTLPAGSVIGFSRVVIQPANDNYVTIADAAEYQTQLSITYTPKFANSLLYIHAEHQCRMVASYAMSGKIKRDGVIVNGSYNRGDLYFDYKGDQVNHHNNVLCHTVTTANNTNATTFTMWVQPYGGTGEVNNGWGNRFMYLMEIKQ